MMDSCEALSAWISQVDNYVTNDVVKLVKLCRDCADAPDDTPDVQDVFVPVLPLFYPKPPERIQQRRPRVRDRSLTRGRASSTETSEDDGPAEAVECVGSFTVTVGDLDSFSHSASVDGSPHAHSDPGLMLSSDHINQFIEEQKRTLLVKCNQLALEYPNDRDNPGPRTVAEAIFLSALRHMKVGSVPI